MRWDHLEDVYPRPPSTYGSKVSPLMELLVAGHQDVELSDEDYPSCVYALEGRYARFGATIGGYEEGGTVVFHVFGDGELLADSGVMRGLRETKNIDVPVAGVQ